MRRLIRSTAAFLAALVLVGLLGPAAAAEEVVPPDRTEGPALEAEAPTDGDVAPDGPEVAKPEVDEADGQAVTNEAAPEPAPAPGPAPAPAPSPEAVPYADEPTEGEAAPAQPEWSLPTVSSTGSGVDDSIVRLYVAFFHRAPDAPGLAHWVGRYRGGESLAQIADRFTRTPEFTAAYGGALNAGDFVKLVYRNVLGRDAAQDLDGYNYWAPRVDNGTFTRGGLMVQFSESREFVSRTGTMAPEPPPMLGPPNSGSGKRIVYCVSCQHVWLVEHDNTVTRHYAVSGRYKTPRSGTYSVFSKSPLAWAGYGGITMQYMVRYTWGNTMALGFHSIPVRPDGTYLQTEAELGQYRSAGCTRQRLEDAEFLYHWAPVGTTVVVLP